MFGNICTTLDGNERLRLCYAHQYKEGENMTKEQALQWLEQFTDEEVNQIYAALLEMRRRSAPVPIPQGSDQP